VTFKDFLRKFLSSLVVVYFWYRYSLKIFQELSIIAQKLGYPDYIYKYVPTYLCREYRCIGLGLFIGFVFIFFLACIIILWIWKEKKGRRKKSKGKIEEKQKEAEK